MQGFGRQTGNDEENDPKYTIAFDDHPTYLHAQVHGEEYSYEVLVSFLKEIADEAHARGYKQVLIEKNVSAGATKEDAYRASSDLPELGFTDIRMAYVDRFLDQGEVNEFGRDVAVHKGIDARWFTDQAMAARWLNSE